jgi:hypothetical protein
VPGHRDPRRLIHPTTPKEDMVSANTNASGRAWARAGFVFGAAGSLAGNVLAAWLPYGTGPDKIPGHAPVAQQAGSLVWPICLILATEVMSRINWPVGATWKLARFGGLGALAAGCAVISYGHIHHVLDDWGYGRFGSIAGAVVLDALMVLCGFAMLAAAKVPAAESATQTDAGTASHGRPSSSPAPEPVPAPLPPRGAGTSESASADAAPDADAVTAETAAVVHLVPASGRSADAPQTASRTASRRASRRGASAAASASRPRRITASAAASDGASDVPGPRLLDAVRAHLTKHGDYPSGRALAASEHVHQDLARAAIKAVRTELEPAPEVSP